MSHNSHYCLFFCCPLCLSKSYSKEDQLAESSRFKQGDRLQKWMWAPPWYNYGNINEAFNSLTEATYLSREEVTDTASLLIDSNEMEWAFKLNIVINV